MTELMRHAEQDFHPLVAWLLKAAVAWAFKSVPQGAATQAFLATADGVRPGEYYADCNISPSTAASRDAALGARLWEVSEAMVAAAAAP